MGVFWNSLLTRDDSYSTYLSLVCSSFARSPTNHFYLLPSRWLSFLKFGKVGATSQPLGEHITALTTAFDACLRRDMGLLMRLSGCQVMSGYSCFQTWTPEKVFYIVLGAGRKSSRKCLERLSGNSLRGRFWGSDRMKSLVCVVNAKHCL